MQLFDAHWQLLSSRRDWPITQVASPAASTVVLCATGVGQPVRRLIDTFQGKLDVPLMEVKRRHHLKDTARLEGVRQVYQWLHTTANVHRVVA